MTKRTMVALVKEAWDRDMSGGLADDLLIDRLPRSLGGEWLMRHLAIEDECDDLDELPPELRKASRMNDLEFARRYDAQCVRRRKAAKAKSSA